jgi:hypothetical protein
MKHACPYCGEKTFTPVEKALCGGLSSAGKKCPSCGGRCVNGKVSLLVNTILRTIALVMILATYFLHTNKMQIVWFGVLPLVIAFAVGFVFDMFCGKLTEALKRE